MRLCWGWQFSWWSCGKGRKGNWRSFNLLNIFITTTETSDKRRRTVTEEAETLSCAEKTWSLWALPPSSALVSSSKGARCYVFSFFPIFTGLMCPRFPAPLLAHRARSRQRGDYQITAEYQRLKCISTHHQTHRAPFGEIFPAYRCSILALWRFVPTWWPQLDTAAQNPGHRHKHTFMSSLSVL